MKIRLQVVLSRGGVASRRRAAEIIEAGRVAVNGSVVTERGFPADPEKDRITVDGKSVGKETKAYFVLNKPRNVVTTMSDERGRRSVKDLVPISGLRVYPVGRLDKDTEGVLLLTNDGMLANRLTHPSYNVRKLYTAEVKGEIPPGDLKRLEKGVMMDGKMTAPCRIQTLKKSRGTVVLRLELHEGRKRQIRRMIGMMGGTVKKLKRISYAGITARGLVAGSVRPLTAEEIKHLKKICRMADA